MRFLSVGPRICLQLPSDSTSRWTPLLFSYTFPTTWACSGLSPARARPWRANEQKATYMRPKLITVFFLLLFWQLKLFFRLVCSFLLWIRELLLWIFSLAEMSFSLVHTPPCDWYTYYKVFTIFASFFRISTIYSVYIVLLLINRKTLLLIICKKAHKVKH